MDAYSEQTSSQAQVEWAANHGSWSESRRAPSDAVRRDSTMDDNMPVLASTRRSMFTSLVWRSIAL
jgi:hypothetical protein